MNFDETQPKTWLSGTGSKTYLNVTLDTTEWIIMNIQNSGMIVLYVEMQADDVISVAIRV